MRSRRNILPLAESKSRKCQNQRESIRVSRKSVVEKNLFNKKGIICPELFANLDQLLETSIGVKVERQFVQLCICNFITNNRLILFLSPNRNYYVAGVGKVRQSFGFTRCRRFLTIFHASLVLRRISQEPLQVVSYIDQYLLSRETSRICEKSGLARRSLRQDKFGSRKMFRDKEFLFPKQFRSEILSKTLSVL